MAKKIRTEELAAWYFRLNGFFTITNFVLHPSRRGSARTDADIVGVRFPHRSEFPDLPGGDAPEFTRCQARPYFVIAEVKRSLCQLNGPWTKSDKENIQAILRDLGLFPKERIASVATSLYSQGTFDDRSLYCSLFCVGETRNEELSKSFPKVPQVTWDEVLKFLFKRFETYQVRKADHGSWDEFGRDLWSMWDGKNEAGFVNDIKSRLK